MQPQIQYVRTSDGVSIAYATVGEGPPILYCPDHIMALEHHWTGSAPTNATIPTLSAGAQVTILDAAGIGASQREVNDFSLEAQARAIEAVATHLPAAQFTLVGSGTAAASAALYAAQQPGRVRGLVCLWPAFPIVHRAGAAIRDNWSLDRRRAAGAVFPDGPVAVQRWYSNAMRESMTPEVYAAYRATFADADLRAIYQRIPVPTLLGVVSDGPSREASLALASVVPICRVATLPDFPGDAPAAILEFMGVQTEPESGATSIVRPSAHGTTTVLFTDLVGHTAMMQRLGDAKGRDVLREHERITREALAAHSGTEVKTDGDSFMASFSSVSAALVCAVALQRAFTLHSETNEPIVVRMGLNVGEPIEEDGDYFGAAVILGARIKDQAQGGEILVPEAVRHMLSGKDFVFADRGETMLKGFEDAVRLYEVRWRE